MRRLLIPLVLAAFVASALTGAGLSANSPAKGPLTFSVRLIQEATYRHPHPPAGDPGDTFSTTLRLFAIGNVLGFPNNTPMGTMAFTWGPLNGSCSTTAAECSGTTNLQTMTRLPGGTITANGMNISLSKGLIVPIQSGTGIFKGVTGSIEIAPQGVAQDVFHLKMP
jgi:hypothetical protein